MHSTPETRAMAQAVLDYWERFPEVHEQDYWFAAQDEDGDFTEDEFGDEVIEKLFQPEPNVCGTAMCAAGTAVFLSSTLEEFRNFVRHGRDWENEGARLLGLSAEEASVIFYSDNEDARLAMKAIAEGDQDTLDDFV